MVIKPKIRGFVCITAHPVGCAKHVQDQIDYVKKQGAISGSPKNVLVVGSSTGYGLSSRIVAAFGCNANTVGVFFERPSMKGKPASAGWYNSAAFEQASQAAGLKSASINGDAFSDEIKQKTIDTIRETTGTVDLVVYSLASPRRTDPADGETYRSVLKPIGENFTAKTLDTDKAEVNEVTLEPASDEEINATRKVMGGEDWELWMQALAEAGVLAPEARTVAYSYIGPEVTWPVYYHGTIGRAKDDLLRAAKVIDANLKVERGEAFVAVNKAVVTQASSAIPVVPLYISILFKLMKARGTHEDCIEQMDRLFRAQMYNGNYLKFDDKRRVRLDDLEMDAEIQQEIKDLWPLVNSGNLRELSDYGAYQENFLRLFGFGLDGVDYEADIDPEVAVPNLVE